MDHVLCAVESKCNKHDPVEKLIWFRLSYMSFSFPFLSDNFVLKH